VTVVRPDALHVVGATECEDLDDFRDLVGPGGIGRDGTHHQGRPGSRVRVERGTSDVARLPGARKRGGEPLLCFYS